MINFQSVYPFLLIDHEVASFYGRNLQMRQKQHYPTTSNSTSVSFQHCKNVDKKPGVLFLLLKMTRGNIFLYWSERPMRADTIPQSPPSARQLYLPLNSGVDLNGSCA